MTSEAVKDANDYIETNPDAMESRLMAALMSELLAKRYDAEAQAQRYADRLLDAEAEADRLKAALKTIADGRWAVENPDLTGPEGARKFARAALAPADRNRSPFPKPQMEQIP